MTTQKITKMTPEQERYLPIFREMHLKKALDCEPVNQDEARQAIINLYKASALTPPKDIYFDPSPIACLQRRMNILDEQRGTKSTKIEFQSLWFVGGLDKYWLTFYLFAEHLGVKYTPETKRKLDAYVRYSETCHVAFLYDEVAFISDRPLCYNFDANRRLHCETGPAIQYRDGYALYAWKGIRIEKKLIKDRHKITTSDIRKEKNAETKRIMIEIYTMLHGPQAIIKDMKATLVGQDTNHGYPRKIYTVDGSNFIHVINGSLEPDGTRKEYFLGVQDNISNPSEAIAASYGIPGKKYKEAVRT